MGKLSNGIAGLLMGAGLLGTVLSGAAICERVIDKVDYAMKHGYSQETRPEPYLDPGLVLIGSIGISLIGGILYESKY